MPNFDSDELNETGRSIGSGCRTRLSPTRRRRRRRPRPNKIYDGNLQSKDYVVSLLNIISLVRNGREYGWRKKQLAMIVIIVFICNFVRIVDCLQPDSITRPDFKSLQNDRFI